MLKKTKKGKKKLRRGFTLVELLAVIVILAIILAVAVPTISNLITNAKQNAFVANAKMVLKAIEYKKLEDSTFDPTDPTDLNINNIESVLGVDSANMSAFTVTMVNGKPSISVTGNGQWSGLTASGTFDSIAISTSTTLYADATGATIPLVSAGMIPVKHNGTNWVKADVYSNWYDYATQKWANAVLVSQSTRATYQAAATGTTINNSDVMAYLVWIPRYKYQLFNVTSDPSSTVQQINITFESSSTAKSTGTTNGSWLTHPSFTYGGTELGGFWVGKFETTGVAATPTILPSISPLTNQTIKAEFTTAALFNTTTTYGLTSTNDSHMAKNLEWGAVALLSQSAYGKYGNSTYTNVLGLEKEVWVNPYGMLMTGCAGTAVAPTESGSCEAYTSTNGQKASTTGNITGVYDMSGGAGEYVMAVMYASDGTTEMVQSSGFTVAEFDPTSMNKYVDKYSYAPWENDYTAVKLGDATGELRNASWTLWNGDNPWVMNYNNGNWSYRGGLRYDGASAGVFAIQYAQGGANANIGFRTVILGS